MSDHLRATIAPLDDGRYLITYRDEAGSVKASNGSHVIDYAWTERIARDKASKRLAEIRQQRSNLARPSFEVTK